MAMTYAILGTRLRIQNDLESRLLSPLGKADVVISGEGQRCLAKDRQWVTVEHSNRQNDARK